MSVKQVFFWSMRVWIFAGALLVGETVCVLSKDSINELDELVKQCGILHVKVRWGLMVLWGDIRINPGEYSTNATLLETLSSMADMNRRVLQRLETTDFLSQLENLDQIYETDQYKNVLDCIPPPYGPNVIKVTRVKAFAKYLNQAKSVAESDVWGDTVDSLIKIIGKRFFAQLEQPLLKLIQLLAGLPYIDGDDRFALLPLDYGAVSWEEVTNTHNAMKDLLSCYVEGAPFDLKRDMKYTDLVYTHFVNVGHECSNVPIVSHLDDLYKKHRFYRLAVSEEHCVYVEGYPNVYNFTRKLKSTIMMLNRFALVQSREGYVSMGQLGRPSIVVNLKKTLNRKQPELCEFSSGYIQNDKSGHALKFGSALLEFVEAKLKVYRTYKKLNLFKLSLQHMLGEHMSHDRKKSLYFDLRFVVAFLDHISQELKTQMLEPGVKKICSSQPFNEEWAEWQTFRCWKKRIERMCSVRENLLLGSGAKSDVTTFYWLFRQQIPSPLLAHLERMSETIPVRTGESISVKYLERDLEKGISNLFAAKFESKDMLDGFLGVYSIE